MKIKVGSSSYNLETQGIEQISEVFDEGEYAGYCDEFDSKIVVCKEFSKEVRQKTLFHELTHAILNEIRRDLSDDEIFVDALSRQLYMLINNNDMKKIMEFVSK